MVLHLQFYNFLLIFTMDLLKEAIPGELSLAVGNVEQVPAPLHEGVNLGEDPRSLRHLLDHPRLEIENILLTVSGKINKINKIHSLLHMMINCS